MDTLQHRSEECEELMSALLDQVAHMIDEPQDDISPDQIEEVRISYDLLRRDWIDLSVDIEFLGLDRAPSISKSEGRQLVRQTDLLTQRLDEIEPRIRHLERQSRLQRPAP